MTKDPRIFLSHIAESIRIIEEYTAGLTQEEFNKSSQVQDAVIRRLEIIGEAAKSIADDFKTQHSEIPWKKVAGMRDVLIHKYFSIDLNLLWNIVEKELKTLRNQVDNLLKETDK
ncbi:MAG: DUF86 domain-containing protein [candidate division Zixibacteria bacterium]|nr:DUF86 domain-containing protein [candidate division Zixibacteria bacterium]